MDSTRNIIPRRLYDIYINMKRSSLIVDRVQTPESLLEFQNLLNMTNPNTQNEAHARNIIYYLYKQNPDEFSKFVNKSKLKHLILWTESKFIVNHFKLQGIIYIKWNYVNYLCSKYKQLSCTESDNNQTNIISDNKYDAIANDI